jgi:hypothetical protein
MTSGLPVVSGREAIRVFEQPVVFEQPATPLCGNPAATFACATRLIPRESR